ncbi:MAG: hypothetical protein IH595_05285 [Bacteroidales bacterium]|nr:hypothetical protein [Bacteroidales bacterium]
MDYPDLFRYLRNTINYEQDVISTHSSDVYNFTFESKATTLLPGTLNYQCDEHRLKFALSEESLKPAIDENLLMLKSKDIQIIENKRFRYHVFVPKDKTKASGVIFMFHGFNEKKWDKYFPWAESLVKKTGKAVLLFPIAFHMNRAPLLWSSRYEMFELSKKRISSFPGIQNSTFPNVAISIHLQSRPERFIWSGLQTYFDVIQLVDQIKSGLHPVIERDSSIDFFAYSIGGLLAKILLMANHKNYFSDSKLCLFCSGAAFNRVQATSKFIIDSEGSMALYSFLIEHLDYFVRTDSRLAHYISDKHPEGLALYSLLNYHKMTEYRDKKLNELSKKIMAVGLKKDNVFPYYEIKNTLHGLDGNIPIKVQILNFDFPYIHEDPFPVNKKYAEEITRAFEDTFELMGNFLKD